MSDMNPKYDDKLVWTDRRVDMEALGSRQGDTNESHDPQDIENSTNEAPDGTTEETNDVVDNGIGAESVNQHPERSLDVGREQHHTVKANMKKHFLLIVAGVLVLIAIIVGIAVPFAMKEDPSTPEPTQQPTPEPGPLWTQIGDDLAGEAFGDLFGYSIALSGDGSILAVGAPWNDGDDYYDRGSVRVYQQNVDGTVTTWTRLGYDIDGVHEGDWFGESVSLSDNGTVLAVGATHRRTDGDPPGYVSIFQFVSNEWTPIGEPNQSSDIRYGT